MENKFKQGQHIIYRNGERYEIGKIKRVTEDGAFVYYSEGDTAAKTPFECMHPLTNEYVIKETSLGGEHVIRPDKDKVSDLLYHIYSIQSPHLDMCGVIAKKYYCEELWKELFGKESELPIWMTQSAGNK